jgi:NAD(P)-dependent dehydrogenase (short-subunit alcohol dehydrogenase family)
MAVRFDGKVAIVTGSSDGIGKAAAIIFAREGGQVVLNARGQERLVTTRSAVRAVGQPPLAVSGDVSQTAVVERLVGGTLQQFGRIVVLVNNAGGGTAHCSLDAVTEEDWSRVVDSNPKSAFLCCKAVAPAMQRQGYGRILNGGSFMS